MYRRYAGQQTAKEHSQLFSKMSWYTWHAIQQDVTVHMICCAAGCDTKLSVQLSERWEYTWYGVQQICGGTRDLHVNVRECECDTHEHGASSQLSNATSSS